MYYQRSFTCCDRNTSIKKAYIYLLHNIGNAVLNMKLYFEINHLQAILGWFNTFYVTNGFSSTYEATNYTAQICKTTLKNMCLRRLLLLISRR